LADENSRLLTAFHGRRLPVPARLAGYAWLREEYALKVPLPPRLAAIGARHRRLDTGDWLILTPRHAPDGSLGAQLEFALKWEGLELALLRPLFDAVPAEEVRRVVLATPTGAYARRVWFAYEWLTGRELDVPPPGDVRAVPVVDPRHQYGLERGRRSPRHRVVDNLPGPPSFCPLVRRTAELEALRARELASRVRQVTGRTHPDVLARAAAFLLLSDSRASFNIEGEKPSHERTRRWGQAIAEAGSVPLTVAELERLQRVVVGDDRFVKLGLRAEGGFVGEHDRHTQEPLPDHVSARAEDLESLLAGIAEYAERAVAGGADPVIAAAAVAFGFVYVHPFEDGNGRLHRWLVHHLLAGAQFSPPGLVFPISAVILRRLHEYRQVLESYSRPLLPLIDWRATPRGNVEVLNDTADYYRYFDATPHAEFLYRCVAETVDRDLPEEVAFLESYDRFAAGVHHVVDMPARTVQLLHRFLEQNGGRLSKRARSDEFAALTDDDVTRIEQLYSEHFMERNAGDLQALQNPQHKAD
jgi:Fic family protein